MTDITEDDRRRARAIIGLITDNAQADEEAIALALAETRERLQSRIDDVEQKWGAAERRYYATERELSARIAELQAKLEASRDCSGRYHKRIAKLEDENARLQERLAIFQRNAGLATTEATP